MASTYALWLELHFFIHNFISFCDAFHSACIFPSQRRQRGGKIIIKYLKTEPIMAKGESGYHMNHKLKFTFSFSEHKSL